MFTKKKNQGILDTPGKSRRLLVVDVLEAKNLLAGDSKRGSSDSYVACTLLDLGDKEIKAESHRTQHVKGTLNPLYDQKFSFGYSYDLDTKSELPSVKFSLFHKGAYSVSETPLGEVVIPLVGIDPDGGTTELWYPIKKAGRMDKVSGDLHLKLTFSRPVTGSSSSGGSNGGGTKDLEAGEEDVALLAESTIEGTEDQEPNELIINVIQGRNLAIMDKNVFRSGGSSDPFVKIKIDGFEDKSTPYIDKTTNPVWNERIVYSPIRDPSLTIEASIYDHSNVQLNKFMGKFVIPLYDFRDKKPKKTWYRVQPKANDDGSDLGEIELSIVWRYSPDVAEIERKKSLKDAASTVKQLGKFINKASNAVTGNVDDDDMDEADEGVEPLDEEDKGPPETPEEAEKKKQEEEERMKELSEIEIKSGDYIIQVHIIEARDLKAENLDGTSDPMVFVEVFDQKQNTAPQYGVTSCVFDELLTFNFRNMDKEKFNDGLIRIMVRDANANPFGKAKMIGALAYDLSAIYTSNKNHEMYRQWVALMDDEDADDVGVQGYLKISVSIIGPGEKMVVHNEQEDIAKEMAAETSAGGDVGSLVLSVPTIRRDWKFLVVSIYRAEGLPVMDGSIGVGPAKLKKAGTDAYCTIQIGGAKPLKTKTVSVNGEDRQAINPIFNYELWYPVSIPSTTQTIKFCVYDEDEVKNELIGLVYEKLGPILKASNTSLDTRWYNIYGKPEFKTEKLVGNIVKAVKAAEKATNKIVEATVDFETLYNNVPDKASTFKGRILAKFRVANQRPPKYDKPEIKPFKLKIPRNFKFKEPPVAEYVLKSLVVVGNQIPDFMEVGSKAVLSAGTSKQDMRIKICIGINEITTKPTKSDLQTCRWNELIRSSTIKLPLDIKQLPDIFVYLLKSDGKPVCFYRQSSLKIDENKQLNTIGFDQDVQWYLLKEDKVVEALPEGKFPGTVLMKLGFGRAEDSEKSSDIWMKALENSRKRSPYQVRVHVYQGKDIPATDSNGLSDPYIKLNFCGQKAKTKVANKTLFPEYYESFVFNDIELPEAENFKYAPMVTFRMYDKDNFDSDDLIGTCLFDLTKAHVTMDPDEELPDPKWIPLYVEEPGDGQGEILVNVQIIPLSNNPFSFKVNTKPKSIIPETKDAYLDIIAVGMRDLAPYHFQPMQYPFLEIELSSSGNKYLEATAPSKRPDSSNPNFLQQILLPCKLPLKSIYASPLTLRAKDTRLGGYAKPVVGVGAIDLTTKLPWCPETYKAPQTDMFTKDPNPMSPRPNNDMPDLSGDDILSEQLIQLDDVGKDVKKLLNERNEELKEDDTIAMQEPLKLDALIQKRITTEDSGAGVFGALNHITLDGKKKDKATEVFVDPDWTQDDGDQPPEWSVNREVLPNELEEVLKTTPFETYNLTRGKVNGMLGNTLKVVGRFKGLVRVIEKKDEPPLFPKELMDALFKPKGYKVRLYVLKGVGLAPLDRDIFGKPSPSDPYLIVNLGKKSYNDRKNAVEDATDVDFYKMIPFDAELPGTSQLEIKVMDKNDFHSDGIIGTTTIDLEDRWFDSRWQQLGEENLRLPSDIEDQKTLKPRWQTKPIERRSLFIPSNRAPRGVLECWVDIMTSEVAAAFEPDDVTLPPKQLFELRVVIWKSKNVPAMDSLEGMSDLFLKVWPEGSPIQETDTHWRCKKGKASWNYRLIFDIELGHSTKAMKFPYLHLQLWDRDLLKWSDCAGEVTVNLGKYYRKAFKRGITLKLFETKKGAAAKRQAKGSSDDEKKAVEILDDGEDIPPDEPDDPQDPATVSTTTAAANKKDGKEGGGGAGGEYDQVSGAVNNPMSPKPRDANADSDDDNDDDDAFVFNHDPTSEGTELHQRGVASPIRGVGNTRVIRPGDKSDKIKKDPPKKTKGKWYDFILKPFQSKKKKDMKKGGKKGDKDEEDDDDDDGETKKPLLSGDEGETEEDRQKKQDDEETKNLVSMIKNLTGLFEDDPEDSSWAHFEQHDHNTGKVVPMGSVAYSVQIWPKDKAKVFPAGTARTEPNTNPFLPPPVGRLKFSWNPFVMGSALCGPKICSGLFCCLLCAAFIVMMIFCQPFLNILINVIFFFG